MRTCRPGKSTFTPGFKLFLIRRTSSPPTPLSLSHTHTHTARTHTEHIHSHICPVGWGYRIYWLHLYRGVRHLKDCPDYDTKQSDSEVPVILELWGMRCTPLLPSLPGPIWPVVVAPDRVLSMGQIEIKCILMLKMELEIELFWYLNCVRMVNWTAQKRPVLTCKLCMYAKLNSLK